MQEHRLDPIWALHCPQEAGTPSWPEEATLAATLACHPLSGSGQSWPGMGVGPCRDRPLSASCSPPHPHHALCPAGGPNSERPPLQIGRSMLF